VRAGAEIDTSTGALAPPLYLSTTFEHGPAVSCALRMAFPSPSSIAPDERAQKSSLFPCSQAKMRAFSSSLFKRFVSEKVFF
jgi:hypothetical protein